MSKLCHWIRMFPFIAVTIHNLIFQINNFCFRYLHSLPCHHQWSHSSRLIIPFLILLTGLSNNMKVPHRFKSPHHFKSITSSHIFIYTDRIIIIIIIIIIITFKPIIPLFLYKPEYHIIGYHKKYQTFKSITSICTFIAISSSSVITTIPLLFYKLEYHIQVNNPLVLIFISWNIIHHKSTRGSNLYHPPTQSHIAVTIASQIFFLPWMGQVQGDISMLEGWSAISVLFVSVLCCGQVEV